MASADNTGMCGILGIVQCDNQRLDMSRRTMERLLDTLAERGPDGQGWFIENHVGFGHRRLAIRDLSHGQQPWVSPDGQCILVYNGELYNDQELRATLSDSYKFRTKCDTEVVMAAYLRWGTACIERFRGMFAFGLYDFETQLLWLVRDRFGVKPLFFSQLGDQLIFASQVATIVAHPQFSKQPDWDVLSHDLTTTRLTLGRRTMYAGIHQLQPAEQLTWRAGRYSISRYWDYPTTVTRVSYEDAVDELHEELEQAVEIRLRSDVPVGMFLSGGVDSSTLASLIRNSHHASMYATCGGAHASSNITEDTNAEVHFAQRCADHVQFDLHPVRVDSPSYLQQWHQLIGDYRTPLSTPSDVVIYALAKAAKQHVGAVIGGEGSDELLCGYEIAHWSGYDYDAAVSITNTNGPQNVISELMLRSITRQYGRSRFQGEADHYFALNSMLPTETKPSILSAPFLREIDDDHIMRGHYQAMYDHLKGASTVEKNAVILHRINLESLLSRLDAATMHAGLEARVPFTDHILVEKMFRLPYNYRIDVHEPATSRSLASADLAALGRLRSKRILRSLANQLLPSELANRKKASFPTGIQQWFQTDWNGWVRHILTSSPFANYLYRRDFLRELVDSPAMAGMWLWPIINLALWGDAEFG